MSGIFGDLFGMYGNSSQNQSYANQQHMMNSAYANAMYNQQAAAQLQNMAYRNNMFQMTDAVRSLDGRTWVGGLGANPMVNPLTQVKFPPKTASVASTAASRVDKPDWEKRADAKEAELNEWLRSIGLGHIAEMDFSGASDGD